MKHPQIDPNDPAFPTGIGTSGMSIRTYLAGQSLAGLRANHGVTRSDATIAYAVQDADDLIAALNKTPFSSIQS
jgi:hypothetical protein